MNRGQRPLQDENRGSLTVHHPRYPSALRECFKRPPPLYYRGNLAPLRAAHTLAVVGSRALTPSNQRVLYRVLKPITDPSLTIVSGLAIGIDALAHTIALDNRLQTIAVLGTSVEPEEIYPPSNRTLAEAIISAGGLLLSPFPAGTPIMRANFPARNIIIAGLARATLVASAAEKSGALITAKAALDAGRDVMTIPGAIDDFLFRGCNNLLRDGAIPVLDASDITRYFGLGDITAVPHHAETAEEEAVLSCLKESSLPIHELGAASRLSPIALNTVLTTLELKGWIAITPDGTVHENR